MDVIQGAGEDKIDWVDVWNRSPERQHQLDILKTLTQQGATSNDDMNDAAEFASSKWFQFKMVLHRLMIQLWRSPVSLPLSATTHLQTRDWANTMAGLRMEQNQPTHLCGSLQRFHILEDWKHLL